MLQFAFGFLQYPVLFLSQSAYSVGGQHHSHHWHFCSVRLANTCPKSVMKMLNTVLFSHLFLTLSRVLLPVCIIQFLGY